MKKLWLSLGLINLMAAAGVFIEQVVRYGIWWEWGEFIHHETFIGLFLYAGIFLLTVALVNHPRSAS